MSERDVVHIEASAARAFVRELWCLAPTRVDVQRIYPDGRHGLHVDLITGEAWLEGVTEGCGDMVLEPGARLVGARLALGAVRGLFGIDGDWGGGRVALTDVAGDFEAVLDRMRRDPRGALGVFDGWLTDRANRAERPSLALRAAARQLTEPTGTPRVAEVADAVGIGMRQLQRRFRAEVGLTPKQFAHIQRARQTRALIAAQPHRALVDIAAELGFADQAQMTRLFGRYCGTTPGRYQRRKQAEADAVCPAE